MKLFRLIIILSIVFILASCNNTDKKLHFQQKAAKNETFPFTVNKTIKRVSSAELDELIGKTIKEYYDVQVKNIKIEKVERIDFDCFSLFTLEYKGNLYVGYIYTNNQKGIYETINIDIFLQDIEHPFSVIQVVGELNELNRKYKVILGSINEESIQQIRLKYSDNTINIIQLDQTNTSYMDITLGDKKKVMSVTAFNDDNKVVYEYSYSE